MEDKEILERWQQPLEDYFKNALVRLIPSEYGNLKVIFNEKRITSENYESAEKCILCNLKKRKTIDFGNYLITSNVYPFAKHHRLIVTKEHYALPKLEDFEFALKISELTGETIILSLKGSGAGIPEHLHFQTFDELMPINSTKTEKITENKDISVGRLIFPSYGIKIRGKNLAYWLFKITGNINYLYNLVFSNQDVILFPRTAIVPSEKVYWKFGATELSGLFVLKIRELLDQIEKEQLYEFMKKATLSKKEEIDDFENSIIKICTC